jgi:hypothetical protein
VIYPQALFRDFNTSSKVQPTTASMFVVLSCAQLRRWLQKHCLPMTPAFLSSSGHPSAGTQETQHAATLNCPCMLWCTRLLTYLHPGFATLPGSFIHVKRKLNIGRGLGPTAFQATTASSASCSAATQAAI